MTADTRQAARNGWTLALASVGVFMTALDTLVVAKRSDALGEREM
jgi:hypothetical protein